MIRRRTHDLIVGHLEHELELERARVADLLSRLTARSEAEYASTRPFVQQERPAEREGDPDTFVVDETGLIDGWLPKDE